MPDATRTTRFRFWLWLIKFIGVIVPRRLRADWLQEWEAELRFREQLLAEWDRLNWRNKFDLLRRSLGAFRDALLLQPRRLEDEMFQDLRFGARMLVKNPGFTCVATLTLALGIGANTAIFSVVNAVLLRPLPFKDPGRLVFISERSEQTPVMTVSIPNFIDWREQNRVFERMAAFRGQTYNLTGLEETERLLGRQVTTDFFSLLGARPILGRTFTPEEDKPGGERVVILSHRFWQLRFGGASNVLGRTLSLDNTSYTVIGVMPKEFSIPSEPVDLWTSLGLVSNRLMFRGFHFGTFVYARLKPGSTLEQARAEMNTIAKRLQEQYPRSNKGQEVRVEDLTQWVVGDTASTLWILLGAVGFVLLIACNNVANLLLARAANRQREIAIRMALGARRGRVIRQLLTESVLLALCACALGMLLGAWGMNGLKAILPETMPRLDEARMDSWVLAFSLGVAVVTGLLFGLAPALQAARAKLNETLKESGQSATSGRARLRGALVVAEVALSLALLIGAGLMMKSFLRLQQAALGFDPEKVLSFQLSLPEPAYAEAQKRVAFFQQLTERLKSLPGVEAAGGSSLLPLGSGPSTTGFTVEDQSPPASGQPPVTDIVWTSPDYFRAMGIRLLRGRYFTNQDTADATPVAIVDETIAQAYWPNQDPIGKWMGLVLPGLREPRFTIVGVVQHVKNYGVDQPSRFETYVPYVQDPRGSTFYVALRTSGDPSSLVSAARANVRELDRNLPIYDVRTMEEYVVRQLAQRRLLMILLGIFAGVAVVLASVGIYGVLSYAVTQRMREIGLRMALGAQTADVLKLVVRQGLVLTLIGVSVGLVGSFALTRVMSSLLFEVSPTDPVTFAVIPLLLVAVALLASYLPARRATKVDPLTALRRD